MLDFFRVNYARYVFKSSKKKDLVVIFTSFSFFRATHHESGVHKFGIFQTFFLSCSYLSKSSSGYDFFKFIYSIQIQGVFNLVTGLAWDSNFS